MKNQFLIQQIEKHPLFSGIPKNHIEQHFKSERISAKELPPNTLAYSSQSSDLKVAILLSGSARVYIGEGSEKALIRTLNSGDVFGIANLYDDKEPFPTQIITATQSRILFISGYDFKDFIESDPTATRNYIRFLSKKIVYLNKKLATLTAGSAEKKLAAHIYEHQVNGLFTVSSLSELASILQMGRASLYRGMDSLIENGLIEKSGKTFKLLNEQKLKDYINKQ